MNQFFEALANMPPEQLATVIIATITGILAPIIGVIVLIVRWFIKRLDRRDNAIEEKRKNEMLSQEERNKLEREQLRAEFELKIESQRARFDEQKAQAEQSSQIIAILSEQIKGLNNLAEAQRENTKAQRETAEAHQKESDNFATAIKNVGEILEVQVTHFQGLNGEVKKLNNDFEAVKTEIASHRQKVDKLLENFDTSLNGKARKEELITLKQELDSSYTRMENRLNELLQEIKALQVAPIIEKEKEEKESS